MERRYLKFILLLILVILCELLPAAALFAQTPGTIYRAATSGGNLVLDPNGDGFVSVPKVPPGFAGTRDEGSGFSEITYRPFPALEREPLGDLTTGASGGHTDLAPPQYTGATGSPIAAFYDGRNVMFRIRLGGASTASKGYSIMIDTNGKFGDLVEGNNPATTPNPGFEFEVVFASNFDVSIYDHRGNATGGSKVWSGSADQFSQRAVAASTGSNNPDYFYDFYVPVTAFPTTGADLLTASTPLRFSGISITSAQSGISGTVSDVGGVNFAAYNFSKQRAWTDVINAFPATTLEQLRDGGFAKVTAAAPVITNPVVAGAIRVSGVSAEVPGSVIQLFRTVGNVRTQVGSTTVNNDGSWTANVTSGIILASGDVITATVTPLAKNVSPFSAPVTVISGICTTVAAPLLSSSITNAGGSARSFNGTIEQSGNQRIRIYAISAPSTVIVSVDVNAAAGASWTTPGVTLTDNSYFATSTPLSSSGSISGCESVRSNQICVRNNSGSINSQIPRITSVDYDGTTHNSSTSASWFEVPGNISKISGTLNLNGSSFGGNIVVFLNGVPTSVSVPFTTNTTNWEITLSEAQRTSLNLKAGDVLNVRTSISVTVTGQTTCSDLYSRHSDFLFLQSTTAVPAINGAGCGRVTTLTGTSTEQAGTVLQFYTHTSSGAIGLRNGTLVVQSGTTTAVTAIVTSQGNWQADLSGVAGGGIAAGTFITARAKATGKVRSVNSSAVVSSAAAPVPAGATFTISPVTEPTAVMQRFTIRGTGPASVAGGITYLVSVDIAGTAYAPVATNAEGTWELKDISPEEVYAGAVVKAIFKSSASSCSSDPVTATVQCAAPSGNFTTAIVGSTSVCYNRTVSVSLSGSEKGVAYQLTNNGSATGATVMGTGGAITLVSGPLTASTTRLSVSAMKAGSNCTTTGIGGDRAVTVSAAPAQPTSLLASVTSGCSVVTTNLVLNGPAANTTYQLINFNTKEAIGQAQTTGGTAPASITLASNLTVYNNITFGVNITPSGGCTSESDRTAIVAITEGPSLTRSVTIDKPQPCSGEQVTISVHTEYNSAYTYVIRDDLNNTIGSAFTGTGTVVSRTTTYAGGVTAARTFRVEVTGDCATNAVLATTVAATPASVAPAANAGTAQEVCGTVTLNGNNASPGVGTWSIVGGTPAGVSFSNINDPRATVTGLPSGVHTFTWTIQNTCGGQNTTTSSNVQITINCAAQYVVRSPKYATHYKSGDELAVAHDSDGGIVAAGIIAGELPVWAELLANGNIVVKSGATPLSGTYSFTVRTRDFFNRNTDTPLTLTVYGDPPALMPLPVELAYFTAVVEKGTVTLQWLTASETDNDKFIIERSANGREFDAIGAVKGQGNSSQLTRYSFTDKLPVTGTAFYRLKQMDFSGKHHYSKAIIVEAKGVSNEVRLQAYPNPTKGFVTVAVASPVAEKAQLQLMDVQGRVVMATAVELGKGLTETQLQVQALSKGMYILKVSGNSIDATVRIVKVN